MVYILGYGSIGRLLGHALRKQGNDVTILLRHRHKPFLSRDWQLRINCGYDSTHLISDSSSGYHFESSATLAASAVIDTLLICTKAYDAAAAITSLASHITADTFIILCNNGIGLEREFDSIFKSRQFHPPIAQILVTHGAYMLDEQTLCHAGFGHLSLASDDSRADARLAYLAQQMRALAAQQISIEDFRQRQLIKLLVNACINPITAINGENNGSVARYSALMQAIVHESLPVLRHAFPVVQIAIAEVIDTIHQVIKTTQHNTSSMQQDIRASRRTEIDYINGAITGLAQEYGHVVPYNLTLLQLVHELSVATTDGERRRIRGSLTQLSQKAVQQYQ